MARVTVEDCIDKFENRFELVLLASHRARMVSSGAQITIDRDNDKNPVVALREIADAAISPGDLKEDLIHALQKYVEVDEPEPGAELHVVERLEIEGGRLSPRPDGHVCGFIRPDRCAVPRDGGRPQQQFLQVGARLGEFVAQPPEPAVQLRLPGPELRTAGLISPGKLLG